MRAWRRAVTAGASATLTLCIGLAALLLPTTAAQAQSGVDAYLAQTNSLRTSLGLAPLQLDPELTALAQAWAEHIASTGELVHPPDVRAGLDESRWLQLGDNIAKGTTFEMAWQGLVESPVHYENLTEPDYTHIGIGVAVAPDGTEFVNQRFMTAAPVEESAPTEPAPTPTEPEVTVPVEPTPTVLGASFVREVNVAVIPPIRYGRIDELALNQPAGSSGLPVWVFAAVGALIVTALLLAWQAVRGRRARVSA